MTRASPPQEYDLEVILRNISVEIARLSDLIAPIEEMLEKDLASRARTDLFVLQNLDILVQTIENVALFLERVSDRVPAGIRMDVSAALADVRLEASRMRLGAERAAPSL